MLDDAQLLQLLPLQSVVADLNSMLATVAERLELSGERAHTRVASSEISVSPHAPPTRQALDQERFRMTARRR